MTDHTTPPAYDDLLDAQESRLLAVAQDLERLHGKAQPPAHLVAHIRAQAAEADVPAMPHSARRARRGLLFGARRPVRRSVMLAAAAVLTLGLVGGVAYATHVLETSGPHIASRCSGTSLTIAPPARLIASPRQFVASGGRLNAQGLKQAASLPHPQYWVLPDGTVIVNTCVGSSVTQIEIGRDTSRGTVLDATSVVPFSQATRPWPVGSLAIPARGGCRPRSTTLPLRSPDRRRVAQLRPIPYGFSRSVRVVWPPCDVHTAPVRSGPVPLPPGASLISFRILAQITYSGPQGAVTVITARASAAAMKPGLALGNPAGKRRDGTRLFDQPCTGDCPRHNLRWLQDGLIVSVSGNVPLERLKEAAADVVLQRT